ncbi:unnamed protein product [Lasius platythorax]|uniref:Integrase catalytic domain-containing protein n=2 Tax=Lasius platythorax TaxID=488582 RepID=A0AAV2NGN9_9HYME
MCLIARCAIATCAIVLCANEGFSTRWATFVWNRVQEIRQLTNPTRWQHVPGDMNPADLPSRGCNARQLLETHWWEGPRWLKFPKEMWPNSRPIINEDLVAHEARKTVNKERKLIEHTATTVMSNMSENQEEQRLTDRLLFLSNYLRIIRTLAWIRRFIVNSQQKRELRSKTALTAKEIQSAETTLLRLVQEGSFSKTLMSKLRAMDIYKDESGLLRTKSLISNRQDTLDFRHPFILDSRHPIVVKLIEYTHRKLGHAHIEIVMNHLREQYWILKGRRAVSSVTRKCITCRRYNAKNIVSSPAVLPENRVREAAVFEITGIDFAGPLFLRDKTKAWICLFTCAVYRAIHLELVTFLSIELFLEAFRRFIARRGRPSTVYTDNETNFIEANRYLQEIDWSKIEEYSSAEKIQWIFNPPSAAWWGGWWERLIRSIKELLRKVLRRALLNYEELTTILCDCEAIINSRPITYLAEDPQQLIPLSPALFLQDLRNSEVPDMDIIASTEKLNRRIKYRQELRDQLRHRFRIEYLGQLSRRNKLKSNFETDIKVGDIVFIGNDQSKRLD